VEIYESFPELKVLGDIISFGSNAGRIFRRWDDIVERLRPLSIDLTNHGFNIRKWTGELMINQKTPPQDPKAPVFNGHRGELHQVIFNYARDELHIPIHLATRVNQYWEEDGQAGLILANGEKVCGAYGSPIIDQAETMCRSLQTSLSALMVCARKRVSSYWVIWTSPRVVATPYSARGKDSSSLPTT